MAGEAAEALPAASVALAVIEWVAWLRAVIGVKRQVPVDEAVAVRAGR